jgi:dienelactone hydrolase
MSTTIVHLTPAGRGRAVVARAAASLRTEVGFARAALGAVALHMVDDAFLQPNPGTSPGDHLASGLIPTAALVGAAWAYPRLRAGFRAVVALLFGFLGLLGGSEALGYAVQSGISGDDYTGLLSLAAGLGLLGVGAGTLWRSRRTDDHRAWRYSRRVLVAAGGLALAFVFALPLAVGYFFTHVGRADVPPAKLGAAHEVVSFETSDGLTLRGWFVPSRNGATVISFPGRKGPQKQARLLIKHGYGVLLFDRRGEGESEGDPNGYGWTGGRDLHAAVQFLQQRSDVDPDRIGGIGLSVGGEMMIQAAAESTAFKAIVSEGGSGRSVRDTVANPGIRWDEVPSMAAAALSTALFSNDTPPATLESLASRIAPRSVFFIYAKHGQGGNETKPNRNFYAQAGQPKQIWEVPEGAHTRGIDVRPKEYERRVIGFFDRALLKETR